jgi:hypothetical protein
MQIPNLSPHSEETVSILTNLGYRKTTVVAQKETNMSCLQESAVACKLSLATPPRRDAILHFLFTDANRFIP